MSEPSQSQANDLLRVLKGEPKKFTVRVHYPDGKLLEFQSDERPKVAWYNEARSLMLMSKVGYDDYPIMKWDDGMIILCEQNPGWKEKE